jgi:8-oxo-dGTP pyrophosphatase MutT (NUDIX family)
MPVSPYIHRLRQKVGHDLLHIPSVTIVVFDEQGRVLLVKDAGSGQWTTPGGAIDPGERPADAAVREMWEETNLLVELTHITGIYGGPEFIITYPNGDQTSYFMTVFAARIAGGKMRPDQVEILEADYFAPDDLDRLDLSSWKRLVLADAFQSQPQTRYQPNTWRPVPGGVRTGGMSDYIRQIRAKVGNEQLMSPAVWAIVVNEEGYILLQKRADNGRWAPPAGGVEPHESPTQAVVREVWEETDVLVEPVRLAGIYSGPEYNITFAGSGDRAEVFSVLYLCHPIGGRPEPDGFESVDVAYFAPEALDFLPEKWQRRTADALHNVPIARFHPATWQPYSSLDI